MPDEYRDLLDECRRLRRERDDLAAMCRRLARELARATFEPQSDPAACPCGSPAVTVRPTLRGEVEPACGACAEAACGPDLHGEHAAC